MQVFELHFNPRRKIFGKEIKSEKDIIFESFCYEPENIYERKLGGLYILGELKNALPQDLRLLEKVSHVIKEKYYSSYLKSPEGALKESLKSLNEFFAEELKRNNTNWLGNLGLAIISAAPQEKPWNNLNFTKIGDIKILLLRDGQFSDIGAKLKLQEIEPYPLKVFSNIVSGEVEDGDVVAVFTENAFEFFQNKNLIHKISQEKKLNDKKIKEILKPEENELLKISGICLLIQIEPEIKPRAILAFEQKVASFPLSRLIKNFERRLSSGYARLKFAKAPKIPFFKITFPQLKLPVLRKNLILVSLLILIFISGFLFSQQEKEKEIRLTKNVLQGVEIKFAEAENFLLIKDEEKANMLLKEAFNDIAPIVKKNAHFSKEALSLKKSIEEELNSLNKLEKIETPEILFEFNLQESKLIPYKMLLSNSTLYFYNTLSSNVYKFEIGKGENNLIAGKINFQFGVQYLDSILFFTKPNFIISLKNNDELQEKNFELPDFNDLASLRSTVYFLDSKSGEIISYSPSSGKKEFWLNPKTKKAISAKSIAVDGSLWLLTKDNEIDRYRRGEFQETLKINLFPELKSPTKIWTNDSLPYLYISEPSQKRIIVLSKTGKIFKQYQSERFDELLDFAVSSGAKTIYLLNGSKIYQLF